jgi:hypothetical protein
LQTALDTAVLAGAAQPADVRLARAHQVFLAAMSGSGSDPQASFAVVNNVVTGAGTIEVPTVMMKAFNSAGVTVAKAANATVAGRDEACLLTYGATADLAGVSMTFNGTPSMSLNGCNVHSNTSIKCNGHGPGAAAAVAAGAATNCAKGQDNASAIPDIYEKLATNITRRCGNATPGHTWRAGQTPAGPAVVSFLHADYVAYHICGDLTLTGKGFITEDPSYRDMLIVVENGRVTLDRNAEITARRAAIVITGHPTLSGSRAFEFPNGNGHSATLTISAPTASTNPWRGMALYQDPRMTNGVDMNWGPGASLVLDGVAYFPKSNFTMRGNASSGNAACSKMAFMTLTVNGNVGFTQNGAACTAAGVERYASVPRLVK